MKRQNDANNATRALPRAQREQIVGGFIEWMEFLYDCLDSGESLEELAIDMDIGFTGGAFDIDTSAAAGALSELSHELCREGLKLIRHFREGGYDRKEVMTFLRRDNAKAVRERIWGDGGDDFYTRGSKGTH